MSVPVVMRFVPVAFVVMPTIWKERRPFLVVVAFVVITVADVAYVMVRFVGVGTLGGQRGWFLVIVAFVPLAFVVMRILRDR